MADDELAAFQAELAGIEQDGDEPTGGTPRPPPRPRDGDGAGAGVGAEPARDET